MCSGVAWIFVRAPKLAPRASTSESMSVLALCRRVAQRRPAVVVCRVDVGAGERAGRRLRCGPPRPPDEVPSRRGRARGRRAARQPAICANASQRPPALPPRGPACQRAVGPARVVLRHAHQCARERTRCPEGAAAFEVRRFRACGTHPDFAAPRSRVDLASVASSPRAPEDRCALTRWPCTTPALRRPRLLACRTGTARSITSGRFERARADASAWAGSSSERDRSAGDANQGARARSRRRSSCRRESERRFAESQAEKSPSTRARPRPTPSSTG